MAQIEVLEGQCVPDGRFQIALVGLQAPPATQQRWEGLLPWQARRVRAYVDGALGERPSIRAAAERARLSPSYFSRRFRQSFGLTFSRYVAKRRIALAQTMMIRSPFNLCQIALACGFCDQAHFTRTFCGVIGSTPSRWRKTAGRSGAIGSC
jgi:AraC family transcriptional regulator